MVTIRGARQAKSIGGTAANWSSSKPRRSIASGRGLSLSDFLMFRSAFVRANCLPAVSVRWTVSFQTPTTANIIPSKNATKLKITAEGCMPIKFSASLLPWRIEKVPTADAPFRANSPNVVLSDSLDRFSRRASSLFSASIRSISLAAALYLKWFATVWFSIMEHSSCALAFKAQYHGLKIMPRGIPCTSEQSWGHRPRSK